jgi:hypothetical protein
MGMYGGGSAPAPVTNNYEESMREALQAQVDMAPQLFNAEADVNYGRPAYARLEQDLISESLFGREIDVDSQGYTNSFDRGAIPEGGFVINSTEEKWNQYLRDNPDVANVINSGRDPDGSSADWARGKTKAQAAELHYNKFGKQEGRKLYNQGIYNAEGAEVAGATKKEYVGGPAGKRREGGGVIDLVAGGQEQQFLDGTTRKAGYDEQGNFLGTSKLEQDMLERVKEQQTASEIGLAQKYGAGLTDAYRAQGGIQDALDDFNALGKQTSDHGGLRSSLVGMAKDELAMGGQLTDRERRRVEQSSRAASSARGRGRDFSAVVDEVANNDILSRQREGERRLFASQVLGLADSGLAQDRAYQAQRIGLEQATSADPFMAITGRTSGATVASGQSLYGNGSAGVGAGPALYNPAQGAEFMANQSAMLNSYNSNVYAADQAKSAAMFGAIAGLGGSLGAAGITKCWVAREVYGHHNPKWLVFRSWLEVIAPTWFHVTYIIFGERFAKFIKDKPRLKARIRLWMDTKIGESV